MANTKASIIWLGDVGRVPQPTGKSIISSVTDAAALEALKTALSPYSECNVQAQSLTSTVEYVVARPGTDVNVDRIGCCILKDTADGSIHKLSIPGFSKDPLDVELTDAGERLTAAAVAAIATACSTATGKTYQGLHGYVITRK